LGCSLGFVAWRNRAKYRLLGCHALFHLALGVGYRISDDVSIQAYGDHISNANLCDNNEGLDQWGIRLGYGFWRLTDS
jgi:lipid A 3-O-deacylase